MAKRYIRINWQNRPNVATPLSAANLNKMDKGIDDIDNAIEEIYNKRVNNVATTNPDTFLAGPVGKTLQDQITTLNNNVAMYRGIIAVDFNNYKQNGYYAYGGGASVSNSPTTDYGILEVLNCNVYISQRLVTATGETYTRVSSDSGATWESWYLISSE